MLGSFQCIEGSEIFEKNLQCPLNICSWPTRGGSTIISTCGDRQKRARGDLCVLHYDYKKITSKPDRENAVFGGFLSLQPSQKVMVTGEFGDPTKLMTAFLEESSDKSNGKVKTSFILKCLSLHKYLTVSQWLRNMNSRIYVSTFHNILPWVFSGLQQHAYGHSLNFWDEKLKLKQTIRLEDEGVLGISCIRFLHNPECNHGFACSPFGNSVFHIHKKTVSDEYVADKIIQYPNAHVEGWIKSEMPAMPLDMVISMDDRFLFISCYLHGFIDQYNICDPFRTSHSCRLFIGGGIHRSLGVKLQRINIIVSVLFLIFEPNIFCNISELSLQCFLQHFYFL